LPGEPTEAITGKRAWKSSPGANYLWHDIRGLLASDVTQVTDECDSVYHRLRSILAMVSVWDHLPAPLVEFPFFSLRPYFTESSGPKVQYISANDL